MVANATVLQSSNGVWFELSISAFALVLTLVTVYFAWFQVENKVKALLFDPRLDVRLEENVAEDRFSHTVGGDAPTTVAHQFGSEADGSPDTVRLDADTEYELLYFVVAYRPSNHRFQWFASKVKPIVFEPLIFWLIFPEDYRVLRREDAQAESLPDPAATSTHDSNATLLNPDPDAGVSLDNVAYGRASAAKDTAVNRRYIHLAYADRFWAREEAALIIPVWVATPDESGRQDDVRAIINCPSLNFRQESTLDLSIEGPATDARLMTVPSKPPVMSDVVAEDVMSSPVVTVRADASTTEAARVMEDAAIGSVVVVDEGRRPAGILTRSHFVSLVADDAIDEEVPTVESVMTHDVETVTPETSVERVVALMDEHGLHHVPVVTDDGTVVGVVTTTDVANSSAGHRDAP